MAHVRPNGSPWEGKMADFEGVYPAIITPMTSEGEVNEQAFRQVMEWNIEAGVDGFWVAGGTGESVLLDDDENMRIAEIAADQNRGRAKNIMHVGAPSTRRAAKLAQNAARAGVEAICCVPPFFYPPTDEAVVEHYRVVAGAADLPLFVYNLPQSTGVEITPELMQRIQDRVPQLKGLKHSAPTFPNVRDFARMGLDCLIGNSRVMLPALTIGATGCVDAPPGIAPEVFVELWRAWQAGDLQRATAAQDKGSDVGAIVTEFGLFGTTKTIIGERLGIDCGDPRPPSLPLTADQRAQVLARAEALGLLREAAVHADD